MVSPLSSRLLGLNGSVNGGGGNENTGNPSGPTPRAVPAALLPPPHSSSYTSHCKALINPRYHQKYRPIKPRVSGYSADGETSSLGTLNTATGSSFKDQRAREVEERSKKRKLEEVKYAAATVKADLAKAGRPFKVVMQGRSRALPTGSVDMSKVLLVKAGQETESNVPPTDKSARQNMTSPSSYTTLFESVRSFYTSPKVAVPVSDDATSMVAPLETRSGTSTATPSTSSEIDSDDNSQDEHATMAIPPRLEQGENSWSGRPLMLEERKEMNFAHLMLNSSLSTDIERALSYSPKPRLVTRSTEPFLIVHANAAYFQLTGIESTSTIGCPLTTLLETPTQQTLSLPSCVALSDAGQDIPVNITTGGANHPTEVGDEISSIRQIKCLISVSPVLVQKKNNHASEKSSASSSVSSESSGLRGLTHFLVELALCSKSPQVQCATREEESPEKVGKERSEKDSDNLLGMTVVG